MGFQFAKPLLWLLVIYESRVFYDVCSTRLKRNRHLGSAYFGTVCRKRRYFSVRREDCSLGWVKDGSSVPLIQPEHSPWHITGNDFQKVLHCSGWCDKGMIYLSDIPSLTYSRRAMTGPWFSTVYIPSDITGSVGSCQQRADSGPICHVSNSCFSFNVVMWFLFWNGCVSAGRNTLNCW
jgi:hypothetical protein